MKPISRLVIGTALAGLVSACSGVEPGFVARQWSEEIRELQINPVFPPREDFMVGDMYFTVTVPRGGRASLNDPGMLPLAVWVGSLDVGREMREFYNSRMTFPPTAGAGDATAPTQPVLNCDEVVNSRVCNIFTGREKSALRRLRVVGFPTFLSASTTKGDLSALVPIEALSAALGADFSTVEAVSVSVPVASSVGLPAARLMGEVKSMLATPDVCGAAGSDGLLALLPAGQRPNHDLTRLPASFYLLVVSEVFYTRAIDISIRLEEGAGVDANARPAGPAAAGNAQGDTPKGETESADGGSNQALAAARARAAATDQALQADASPGASVKFVSASADTVGMRRVFERPVAIGYRGIVLQVDAKNCRIIGGGAEDVQEAPSGQKQSARSPRPGAARSWRRPSGPLDVLHQAKGIVDRGVDVAAGHGIADAE